MNHNPQLISDTIDAVENCQDARMAGTLARLIKELPMDEGRKTALRRELADRWGLLLFPEDLPTAPAAIGTPSPETLTERCARLGALLSSPEGLLLLPGHWHERCTEWRVARKHLEREEAAARLAQEQERVALETDAARWRALVGEIRGLHQSRDGLVVQIERGWSSFTSERDALTAFVDGLRTASEPADNEKSAGVPDRCWTP